MKTAKLIKVYLMMVFVFYLPGANASAEQDPVALVDKTIKDLFVVLSKEDGNNTAEIRKQGEELLFPHFDFLRMTAYAVGRPWRGATDSQKDALIAEFRTLLTSTYFNTMLRYRDADVSVNDKAILENKGKESTVKTDVMVKDIQDPVSIDYILYKTENGWKVFNINVEGASLVTVYRNQFGDEVSRGGIDGLIQALKDKNQKIKG